MQFHLETDELNLLANVLLEQDPGPYQENDNLPENSFWTL